MNSKRKWRCRFINPLLTVPGHRCIKLPKAITWRTLERWLTLKLYIFLKSNKLLLNREETEWEHFGTIPEFSFKWGRMSSTECCWCQNWINERWFRHTLSCVYCPEYQLYPHWSIRCHHSLPHLYIWLQFSSLDQRISAGYLGPINSNEPL